MTTVNIGAVSQLCWIIPSPRLAMSGAPIAAFSRPSLNHPVVLSGHRRRVA